MAVAGPPECLKFWWGRSNTRSLEGTSFASISDKNLMWTVQKSLCQKPVLCVLVTLSKVNLSPQSVCGKVHKRRI